MDAAVVDLARIWQIGYSVAELWGNGEPVSRGGPTLETEHLVLWGILSIVEDQVSPGAGHRYLRDRLWNRDWIAIGLLDQRAHIAAKWSPGSPSQIVVRRQGHAPIVESTAFSVRIGSQSDATRTENALVVVPRIENAKFGRRPSAVGNGVINYVDIRIVHARHLASAGAA